MADTEIGGLRERKKRATQQAIERSAVELSLEHGYESVTVEMICDRAMISQRTFFNYAGSKEGAVLGIQTAVPDDDLRRSFITGASDSPLQDLILTITAAFSRLDDGNSSLFRMRRQVIHANPELVIKEFARMEQRKNSIVELVRERLCSDAPDRDNHELQDEARMVVSLAFGIIHYLVRDWLTGGFPGDAADKIHEAIDLARKVAGA